MVFIDERKQRRDDDKDMLELLEVYRSLRRLGKWAAGLFAFLLVIASLALALKEVLKK